MPKRPQTAAPVCGPFFFPHPRMPHFILQKTEADQFGDYLSLVQNPRIMALISGRALDTAEAETQYAAIQARNLLHPACGYFYLRDRNGQLMGLCKLQINRPNESEAEIGYLLHPDYWGRGLASAVCTELLARAHELRFIHRLRALTDPANHASAHILRKHGFALQAEPVSEHGYQRQLWLFPLPRAEHRAT